MSSAGNRTTRFGSTSSTSKMDDAVPSSITADEVEKIIQKAVSSAMSELTDLFNSRLAELGERVEAAEVRVTLL